MVTLTSQQQQQQQHNTNLSSSLPPYLAHKEPPFLGLNLSEPTRIQIRTRSSLSPILTGSNRKLSGDDEIGVFRAEKYFNGAIDDDDTCSRISSTTLSSLATRSSLQYKLNEPSSTNNINNTTLDLEQIRARIQPRTPSSVRSESSWNSRSVLLRNLSSSSKTPRSNSSKVIDGKKILATFGCKCSDKNSVQTNTNNHNNNKSSSTVMSNSTNASTYKSASYNNNSHRSNKQESVMDDIIHKPLPKVDHMLASKPASFRAAVKSPVLLRSESPEIYGSRRVSALWDHATVISGAVGGGNTNNNNNNNSYDSGSDASSDLFEIDSLTGKTNPFMARRRSGDHTAVTGLECMTPMTGYAPSEASIQWSVVTASAVDYAASVVSDFDEAVMRPPAGRRNAAAAAAREAAQRRRAGSALLLGCKSQKAVCVAGEAHRTSPVPGYEPPSLRFRTDSPARFQAEIARIGHQMPRLASPSPRNSSHLLYIQ